MESVMRRNVLITIDSCGWLEYYTAGPLAEEYGKYLKDLKQIVTPVIISTFSETPKRWYSSPSGRAFIFFSPTPMGYREK